MRGTETQPICFSELARRLAISDVWAESRKGRVAHERMLHVFLITV